MINNVGRTVLGVRMGCQALRRCCLNAVFAGRFQSPFFLPCASSSCDGSVSLRLFRLNSEAMAVLWYSGYILRKSSRRALSWSSAKWVRDVFSAVPLGQTQNISKIHRKTFGDGTAVYSLGTLSSHRNSGYSAIHPMSNSRERNRTSWSASFVRAAR